MDMNKDESYKCSISKHSLRPPGPVLVPILQFLTLTRLRTAPELPDTDIYKVRLQPDAADKELGRSR
jgi:hypothetical protein